MQEADLYKPLKEHLIKQGYTVKGEIQNCDVIAVKDTDSMVVVELKLSLNLTIILQAVDRLKFTDIVYIGVPKGLAVLKKQRKKIIKLLRMLGLGLIIIDPNSAIGNVDVICDPGEYKPRQIKKRTHKLMAEFQHLEGDPNIGGSSTKQGRMTAYRQKALAIASYLLENGDTKASIISKALSEPKSRNILYDNVYGWFDRFGKGIYGVSPRGNSEIPLWLEQKDQD